MTHLRTQHLSPEMFDVDVVIPARNEETRLGPCLASLTGAPVNSVLVIDDDSTDNTRTIAESFGAAVITAPPLQEGQVGKPAALQFGLGQSDSSWLLFLDADVRVRPGFVSAAVSYATANDMDFLSFAPQLKTSSPLQQCLQASLLTGLIYRFGPPSTRRQAPDSTWGNGQCFLARRQTLIEAGGFSSAINKTTDDIALFQHLVRSGFSYQFVNAASLVEVEMYESSRQTMREWGRSLAMSDVLSLHQQAVLISELFLMQVLPLVRIAKGQASLVDWIAIALRNAMNVAIRESFVRPRAGLYFSQLADIASWCRLLTGAFERTKTWRGRSYVQAKTEVR